MKNIIFEKTANANDAPIWKILYDSEAKRNGAQIKTKYADNNLARLRVAARLSQQQLADIAGVSENQIQRFESGERAIGNAAATTVAAIAAALSTDVETLIADAG